MFDTPEYQIKKLQKRYKITLVDLQQSCMPFNTTNMG